jgi:acyl carrier protein
VSNPINAEIRAFIVENFLFGDTTQPLGDETSLIEADLIDSTGVLELVAFIEERYGFTIADAEIVPDNLNSIASIGHFIASRTAPMTMSR